MSKQMEVHEALKSVERLLGPRLDTLYTFERTDGAIPVPQAMPRPVMLMPETLRVIYDELVRLQHVEDNFLRLAAHAMESRR